MTVCTLTLTGIAADSPLAGGNNIRLGRRLASTGAIFVGGAIGALLLYKVGLALPLIIAGVCIFVITIAYATHPASKIVASNTR